MNTRPTFDPHSRVVLGSMNFGKSLSEDAAHELVIQFSGMGGSMIDTADSYGAGLAEEIVGRVSASVDSPLRICTKTGRPIGDDPAQSGYAPARLRNSVDASRERLDIQRIDLYLLHQWDPQTPIQAAVDALVELREAGSIADYGFGNMPAWVLGEALGYIRANDLPSPTALQYHYSLGCRDIEAEVLPVGEQLGAKMMAWSPLSGGLLTGKYKHASDGTTRRGDKPAGRRGYAFDRLVGHWPAILGPLRSVAEQCGQSPAQVALSWLLADSRVGAVVLGAESGIQLSEVLLGLSPLDTLLREQLDAATQPRQTYPMDFITIILRELDNLSHDGGKP